MSSKMFLSAFAGVAAMAVVAAPAQDPTFEFPASKHIGFDVAKEDSAMFGQTTERVSVSFKDATVREVLDWLKNAGVNFVVSDEQVRKDAHVSINVVNQPISELMTALANSWGGHWEKQKGIWVFQNGRAIMSPGGSVFSAPEGLPGQGKLPKGDAPLFNGLGGKGLNSEPGVVHDLFGKDSDYFGQGELSKEQSEQLKKMLQGMNDPKSQAEFRKSLEQLIKDHQKNSEEFQKTFKDKGFEYKIDPKALDQIRKQSEEMAKAGKQFRVDYQDGVKGFKWDGKDFKPLDEKAMKDMQKHIEEMNKGLFKEGQAFKTFDEKSMQDMQKRIREMDQKAIKDHMKGFTYDGKDFKPLDDKMIQEIRKQAEEMAKVRGDMKFMPWTDDGKVRTITEAEVKAVRDRALAQSKSARAMAERARTEARAGRRFTSPQVSTFTSEHNLKAIYESLTPTQTQKLKRAGYLNYSDLNSKQRALLGVITDDTWTISYKTDNASLTIKSDR